MLFFFCCVLRLASVFVGVFVVFTSNEHIVPQNNRKCTELHEI
jgi:hypothetical protein